MGVTISPELEKAPYWPAIRDYVNERMAAEGWEGSVFIRTATGEEEAQLRESGNSMLSVMRKNEPLELAISKGKYLNFSEILKLDRKINAAFNNILLHLWVAQMECIGKIEGGCDS